MLYAGNCRTGAFNRLERAGAGCGIIGTGCPPGCPGPLGLGRGIRLSVAGGLPGQVPVLHCRDERGELLGGHGEDAPLPAVGVLLGVLHAGPSCGVADGDARLCAAGSAGFAVARTAQCLFAWLVCYASPVRL